MALSTRPAGAEEMSELNITPLIDVMLVLLTLLLITLPIQTHVVKLELPRGATLTTPPPVVDLAVDFDGTVSWNGHALAPAELDARLARAARQTPQPEFHITANRLARYDTVARIMAGAQRLGIVHIGIVGTERFAR